MSVPAFPYPHIEQDARGVPVIAGTTMKVVELINAQRSHGWSPEELSFQFPYLSMAQIHAALAYYWDNQESLDEDMVRRSSRATDLQTSAKRSPLGKRLTTVKHKR